MMTKRFITIAIIILSLSLPCFAADENRYYDAEHHFSFVLPEGWERLSDDDIDEAYKRYEWVRQDGVEANTPLPDKSSFVAFAKMKNRASLVVEFDERFRLTKHDRDELRREAEASSSAPSDFRNELTQILLDAEPGETFADYRRAIFFVRIWNPDELTTSTVATIFAKHLAVKLELIGDEYNDAGTLDDFQRIVNSFKFDKGYGFEVADAETRQQMSELSSPTVTGGGKEYWNSEGHFSFTIPEGWEEVPADELVEYCQAASAYTGRQISPESFGIVFHIKGTSCLSNPFFALRIDNVGRVPESELERYAKSVRTAKSGDDIPLDLREAFKNGKVDSVVYDGDRHHLRISGTVEDSSEEPMKAMVASFFGCKDHALLMLVSNANAFYDDVKMFRQVIDSFTFDSGYEYEAEVHKPRNATFWQAIIDGLGMFLHWETYVAGIICVGIAFFPTGLALIITRHDDYAEVADRFGCLIVPLGGMAKLFACYVFLTILFPIMLGFGEDGAWRLPWALVSTSLWTVLKVLGLMLLMLIAAAFLPIIGSSGTLGIFAMGAVVLWSHLRIVNQFAPELEVGAIDLTPPFFTLIGMLLISAIVTWASILAVAYVATLMQLRLGESDVTEAVGMAFVLPLGAMFGMIPVFIYGAWLGNQIAKL